MSSQRAIEEVLWRNRIWPEANPSPKPPLAQVLPDAAIRARVEDTLRKTNALERRYGISIIPRMLSDEMERMAAGTRAPEVLRELFAALGNDPARIAECLARPAVADRLLRAAFSQDDRIHGNLRRRAAAEVSRVAAAADLKHLGGSYAETTWRRTEGVPSADGPADLVELDGDGWAGLRRELADALGIEAPTAAIALPAGRVGPLRENDGGFSVTASLASSPTEIRTATVTWEKVPFTAWWNAEHGAFPAEIATPSADYAPVTPRAGACSDDTWTPTRQDVPDGRYNHTAVWTGSEMIVWGGTNNENMRSYLDDGARYDPAIDTWTPISRVGAPAPRHLHSAVWTGTSMIVWGGVGSGNVNLQTGGRYDLASNTWTPTATSGAPSARARHRAVWTGSRMVLWGGFASTFVGTGGRYDPVSDAWTATNETGAPAARSLFSMVFTGDRVVVWGGQTSSGYTNSGGRYDPVGDAWTATNLAAAPSARVRHTAVWSGSTMIVWGGAANDGTALSTGGRYDPTGDSWAAVSTSSAPAARQSHTAVWTGSRMIVWGGSPATAGTDGTGGLYDPVSDVWQGTATTGAPRARELHTAVWSGSRMIVWGGRPPGSADTYNSGGRFDPAGNGWTPTSTGTVPEARYRHAAAWTGSEMIVWGGRGTGGTVNSGGRYVPATDTWSATSTATAPSAREYTTAIWTGAEMIVWGGNGSATGTTNTGGRYSPASDVWAPTGTGTNVPSPRYFHTAVWTGTEMIVWGGTGNVNTGGRYDPGTDAWQPTSTGANVPVGRFNHTAVWTGAAMIVWGGSGTGAGNSGGRYDPAGDAWQPTSTGAGCPSSRDRHTAVWTGSRMAVWGGFGLSEPLDTGALYDPTGDAWTPIPLGGAPFARYQHTAAWTGAEMIVWGGNLGFGTTVDSYTSTGGRYNPTSDAWIATSLSAAPSPRAQHVSVWAGDRLVVFGGSPLTASGGGYCPCTSFATFYRDVDGDGFGIASQTVLGCAGSPPAGYAASAGDCDDTRASVYPGATQLCDGLANDCSDPSWPAVPSNEADADGDLYRICQNDCNDANPLINPGRVEACNGIDDNCDGLVDEAANGVDGDLDGILGACDNCPLEYNPNQTDFDLDSVGDHCDLNDGMIYVLFRSKGTLWWQQELTFTTWNVYKGDLAVLRATGVFTQAPGSNPLAGRDCGLATTSEPEGTAPALGQTAFFLVSGVQNGVESSLSDSSGVSRPNTNPCP